MERALQMGGDPALIFGLTVAWHRLRLRRTRRRGSTRRRAGARGEPAVGCSVPGRVAADCSRPSRGVAGQLRRRAGRVGAVGGFMVDSAPERGRSLSAPSFPTPSRHSLRSAVSMRPSRSSPRSNATALAWTGPGCWRSAPAAAPCCWQPKVDLDTRNLAAQHAMTEHDRLPMPFERARTQLLVGQLHRRDRQKDAASVALREALAAFETIGTPLWAERHGSSWSGRRRAAKHLGPDPGRAAGRRARRVGNDQPRRRGRVVHQSENRRGQPRPRLSQARDPLPRRTRPPSSINPTWTNRRVISRFLF